MFELGELIGDGAFSAFFRIREHPTLGVKVSKYIKGGNAKESLEKELKKAKVLMTLNLPVPKYIEVIQVKVPEYFEETLARGLRRNIGDYSPLKNKEFDFEGNRESMIKNLKGKIVYGLLMEYIESDLSLVSPKRLKYVYQKEKAKIEQYGISIGGDSRGNVLWSKNRARLYFIDFEFWNLSGMHNPTTKMTL
jgi:serine/threonine protein kinase